MYDARRQLAAQQRAQPLSPTQRGLARQSGRQGRPAARLPAGHALAAAPTCSARTAAALAPPSARGGTVTVTCRARARDVSLERLTRRLHASSALR